MIRSGLPRMFLVVHGDWESVIDARAYREVLIDQKPDADDDYREYRIPCKTTTELVIAYNEFRVRLNLESHFGFEFLSNNRDVQMAVVSGGNCRDTNGYCSVDVNVVTTPIEAAARNAIALLSAAIA